MFNIFVYYDAMTETASKPMKSASTATAAAQKRRTRTNKRKQKEEGLYADPRHTEEGLQPGTAASRAAAACQMARAPPRRFF